MNLKKKKKKKKKAPLVIRALALIFAKTYYFGFSARKRYFTLQRVSTLLVI